MIPRECEKCIHCRVCAYNNPKRKQHCGFYEESRQTGKWIPVSEKLPDVGQVVIVTDDREKVYEYELNPLDVDKYTTGKWRFLEHEIIAWMPLPEPYMKGGAEE